MGDRESVKALLDKPPRWPRISPVWLQYNLASIILQDYNRAVEIPMVTQLIGGWIKGLREERNLGRSPALQLPCAPRGSRPRHRAGSQVKAPAVDEEWQRARGSGR